MILLWNIPMITPSKEKIFPMIIHLATNKIGNKQIWNFKSLFKIPTKSETVDRYSFLLFWMPVRGKLLFPLQCKSSKLQSLMCKQTRRLFHVEKMKTAANQQHVLPAAWTWLGDAQKTQVPSGARYYAHSEGVPTRDGGQRSPGSSQGPPTFCIKPAVALLHGETASDDLIR